MKLIYFTLTKSAGLLADRIRRTYPGDVVTRESLRGAPAGEARRTAFAQAVADAWNRYDGLVFIMASGIVVRTIAPLLKSKTSDPAVIVMDSDGRFVISLLSGHLGGANALAGALAKVSGGQAVITTGTDVAGTLAFDVLAKENHCLIENIKELKYISGAMIERLPVDVYCPYPVRFQMPENVRLYADKCEGSIINSGAAINTKASAAAAVIIGHKFTFRFLETAYKNVLYLRPKNLCIGVGCRKNISFQAMADAFGRFMELNGIVPGEVAGLATIALKKDEPAILKLAQKYGLPLHIIEDEAIKALEKTGAVSTSEFVKKTTGVGAVSEGSALALAEKLAQAATLADSKAMEAVNLKAGEAVQAEKPAAVSDRAVLIRPKTKYDGITFALAECCRHLISGSAPQ